MLDSIFQPIDWVLRYVDCSAHPAPSWEGGTKPLLPGIPGLADLLDHPLDVWRILPLATVISWRD